MKKRSILKAIEKVPVLNPVAKQAYRFNKAHVFTEKTAYRRKAKHRVAEDFPNGAVALFGKSSAII